MLNNKDSIFRNDYSSGRECSNDLGRPSEVGHAFIIVVDAENDSRIPRRKQDGCKTGSGVTSIIIQYSTML